MVAEQVESTGMDRVLSRACDDIDGAGAGDACRKIGIQSGNLELLNSLLRIVLTGAPSHTIEDIAAVDRDPRPAMIGTGDGDVELTVELPSAGGRGGHARRQHRQVQEIASIQWQSVDLIAPDDAV